MRAKVSPSLVEILKTRIHISRELKLFTLEDVAQNWGITSRTLFRYDSERDRELSRLQSKRITDSQRLIDKTLCQLCNQKLAGHKRCQYCTKLLHRAESCNCMSNCIVTRDPTRLLVQITKK